MNDVHIWKQKDYRRISSGRMIQFGDSQDIAFLSAWLGTVQFQVVFIILFIMSLWGNFGDGGRGDDTVGNHIAPIGSQGITP